MLRWCLVWMRDNTPDHIKVSKMMIARLYYEHIIVHTDYNVVIYTVLQWRSAYLLHFYDMIWYAIRMLWYAISMLCYEIFKNDMIWYAFVWYGMVCYAMLWDLRKRSFFHRRVPFLLHFKLWFTGFSL